MSKPIHENTVTFRVTGERALFSDPVTRVGGEKCTYQVPTYEALKGILSSVYWKPTIVWYIDAVRVINQIQTEAVGIRNLKYQGADRKEDRDKYSLGSDLSYYTYLRDVCYQVKAHFEWNDRRPELACDRNENKHHNIAKRMIEKGGRRDIFLGTRECQGYVEPCEFGAGKGAHDDIPELSFGLMLHGITYADEAVLPEMYGKMTANFWYPVMKHGVIAFPRPENCPLHKTIREMKMKTFSKERGNFSGLDEFNQLFER